MHGRKQKNAYQGFLWSRTSPYALADGEACAATALKILYWTLAYSAQLPI